MAQGHPGGYVPKAGVEVAAFWFLPVCPFNHYTKLGLLYQLGTKRISELLHLSLISFYTFKNIFLFENTFRDTGKTLSSMVILCFAGKRILCSRYNAMSEK